jgi:hypothetical protein
MTSPGCPITKLQLAAINLMKKPVFIEFCNKCNSCKFFMLKMPEFASITSANELKKYIENNASILSGLLLEDIEQCALMPIHMILYFNMSVFRYEYRLMKDFKFSDKPASTIDICVALSKIAIAEELDSAPIKRFAEQRNSYIGSLQESYPTFQFPHDLNQTITPEQIEKYGAYFNMAGLTNIMVTVGIQRKSAALIWVEFST